MEHSSEFELKYQAKSDFIFKKLLALLCMGQYAGMFIPSGRAMTQIFAIRFTISLIVLASEGLPCEEHATNQL